MFEVWPNQQMLFPFNDTFTILLLKQSLMYISKFFKIISIGRLKAPNSKPAIDFPLIDQLLLIVPSDLFPIQPTKTPFLENLHIL